MKLITLHQPWASAMALGIKAIETRGWPTIHRGKLAIHAALAWNKDCREFAASAPCWNAMSTALKFDITYGAKDLEKYRPMLIRNWLHKFGVVVAVCDLVDCLPMEFCDRCDGCGWREGAHTIRTHCADCGGGGTVPRSMKLSDTERAFGLYEPGRFAFVTANMRRLREPIPFKSRQGKLLDWDPPANLEDLYV